MSRPYFTLFWTITIPEIHVRIVYSILFCPGDVIVRPLLSVYQIARFRVFLDHPIFTHLPLAVNPERSFFQQDMKTSICSCYLTRKENGFRLLAFVQTPVVNDPGIDEVN